jgi:hypothetical protein
MSPECLRQAALPRPIPRHAEPCRLGKLAYEAWCAAFPAQHGRRRWEQLLFEEREAWHAAADAVAHDRAALLVARGQL